MDKSKLDKLNNTIKVYATEIGVSANASGNTLMFFLWFFVAMTILLKSIEIDATTFTIIKYVAIVSGIGKYVYEYMLGKKRLGDAK